MKLDTVDLRQVELADRTLHYLCRGEGAPTVVVDQGNPLCLGGAVSPARGWLNVFCEVGKIARICLHDGAARGGGEPGAAARTHHGAVDDLRALLRDARLTPPYVLVGHSIGGLNARLFASRYPDEVAGMVLVDSFHPNQQARLSKSLRPQAAASLVEGIDFQPGTPRARTAGTLGIKPLVVLTRSSRDASLHGLPVELVTRLRAAWLELQADLLNLSANSTHVIANHAGHNIQLDEPQLVIDAIARVVREIRSRPHGLH